MLYAVDIQYALDKKTMKDSHGEKPETMSSRRKLNKMQQGRDNSSDNKSRKKDQERGMTGI